MNKENRLKAANKILENWDNKDSNFLNKRELFALKQFVIHYPECEYDYKGNWKSHLKSVVDRMNGGRAKAILRLYKEQN